MLDVVLFVLCIGLSKLHFLKHFGSRTGSSPMHMAAWKGHLSCLKFLVSKNADVNALEECVLLLLLLLMIAIILAIVVCIHVHIFRYFLFCYGLHVLS